MSFGATAATQTTGNMRYLFFAIGRGEMALMLPMKTYKHMMKRENCEK